MIGELNKSRYRALELLADHVKIPSRELTLDAIISDISDDDLRWVTTKVHYFLLKILEESDYDPADEELVELIE